MNFHKFPKAQRELADAARVEATPGQISETKEEGAPQETQTKEKTRGAKKKT